MDNALSALALPLLALAEYLAVYVTRNLYLTVLSRVLRVQLLCHLGCLAPAAAVLVKLIDAGEIGLHCLTTLLRSPFTPLFPPSLPLCRAYPFENR